MQCATNQDQTYQVDKITFIVTPVYTSERGETMFDILLKLMKADVVKK